MTDAWKTSLDSLYNEIYSAYRWKHKDDNLLLIYDSIISLSSHFSIDIHIATTNYDRAIENY